MLLRPELAAARQLIAVAALLLGSMGMASVGNAKVPLGVVSFSENLFMAVMGAAMVLPRP